MVTKRALPALLALPWLLAPAVRGQETETDWKLERIEWTSPASNFESVTITNRYGAIRIGGTVGELAESAELHGVVQRHDDDPRAPELIRDVADGNLRIEVAYPGDADVPEPADAWRKRRTDITVYVDETAELHLETLHGKILVKGYVGPIHAISESGKIEIKGRGPIQAMSRYGEIEVFFQSPSLPTPLELETVTGSIHLSLPWNATPRARIETRGEISSDYSIGIEWLPDSTLKRGSVDDSPSAVPVVLQSNRGNVRLLRRIDDRRAAPTESTTDALERRP